MDNPNLINALNQVKTVLAIEVLEYNDKNLLLGDNESRSRMKQDLLNDAILTLSVIKNR